MRLYNIILTVLLLSFVRSDEVYFNSVSTAFVIDTNNPQIHVISPSAGDIYGYDESIIVEWDASDQSILGDNSIEIFVQIGMSAGFEFISSLSNLGSYPIPVSSFLEDDLDNAFNHILISVIDKYGNSSSDLNSGYFIIGNPDTDYSIEDEEISLSAISSIFEIDTQPPIISVISPNDNALYYQGESIQVEWDAQDNNLMNNSISIKLITDYNPDGQLYDFDHENDGVEMIVLPNISTNYAKIFVSAADEYGFSGSDDSDDYFIIGIEDAECSFGLIWNGSSCECPLYYSWNGSLCIYELEQIFEEFETVSSNFIMDTKEPEFLPLNPDVDNVFFYPNGGNTQIFENYMTETVPVQYNLYDDSQDGGHLGIYQTYILGGWYIPIALDLPLSTTSIDVDLSRNGLIENSIWAKLKFRAVDRFGNVNDGFIDDYFVLGNPEGDLDINWVDEEADEIMINWAWEAKHSIMIRKSAINEYLQPGDKITLVDNLGIPSSSCDDEYGYTELKEITVNDNNTIGGPKSILKGINHCAQQGQRRIGFVEGNPIIFKITKITDATSYFVSPDTESIGGNTTYTAGGHTVIRSIDFANPITIDNYNPNYLVHNERDFDSFNVYYKVNAANLRDCNPVPVSGYNDSNGDGESDANWCYDTTVYGETDYLTNVPGMTQSSILTYRVWLMNNTQQEVFRTIDTSMEINIELSDLYDKSLNSGWNWFSLNMTNTDMGINNILSSLESTSVDGDYIKSQGGYADFYIDSNGEVLGWWGTIDSLDNMNMYKLDIYNPGNITFEGAAVDVLSNPLELSSGWNWVSYLPQEIDSINVALASLASTGADGDYMKSQGGYADFYPGFGWFGTLETLSPRAGYMLDVENISTLTYPESGSFFSINNEIDLSREIDEFNYQDYENNGSVTIALDLDDITPQVNDEIRAFYNGEIRGISKAIICPINDNLIFPMMMYSDSSDEEFTFRYYGNTNQEIDLLEKISFVPDMHLNNAIDPYIMTDEHPFTYSLSNAYPNPFNPSTTIDYSVADDINNLNINIYDIQGRFIDQLHSGKQSKGEYQIIWNASRFASGIYFIHMIANEHVFTKKVMLVK